MRTYPTTIFLLLSFFCAYPFVITDVFLYTIPWMRYYLFIGFLGFLIEGILIANHAILGEIRLNIILPQPPKDKSETYPKECSTS